MARDLTAALHALTLEAQGQTTRQDKALSATRPATGIPPRAGSSGPISEAGAGTGFALGGERYLTSTDGLLFVYFPDSLTGQVDGKNVVIGAIEVAP